jgi:hypothetical protein
VLRKIQKCVWRVGVGVCWGLGFLLARHWLRSVEERTTPQRQCKRERWQNSNRSVSNVLVSSKDTVSEQVVQARQTRRRRAEAGFWVRLMLAGTREWWQQAVTLNVTGGRELLYPAAQTEQVGNMQGSRKV